MELWGVPGAAVAVVKDQKVVFANGFGVRDLEPGGRQNHPAGHRHHLG